MDDTQTLELQLKSTVQSAIAKMDQLTNKLNKIDSATNKAKSSAEGFSKAFSLGGVYVGAKRLTSQMLQWMNLSIDFTEQLNLFNVVFGNVEKNGVKTFSTLGKKATQFQNQMNEAFGTNKTETLKYQALFQSMGENVGIPDSYSAVMSETMTKLTYDLASLYNKSESTTGEALRAGVYAGQTKPLRSYGIDVTQTSMQPILNSLGITDRSVKQMSQAEKEILRYIATLKQAQIAMGDMANTIESPSNQLKVFKQQLVEAKVALTSLFIGGFANILPYANAILMVVKELSKAIASFFGIELTDYNNGIASTEDAYSGIGESIDEATGKAKKFKREIMGFDQVHNINENDESGSGSASTSGGIDQRLLDAITGYDNGMDKVRMKATEIRDKIMEWLGFHKKINPLTGETYFEYQGIDKTLKNMWKSFKGLSAQGKILVSLGLLAGATKLLSTGKKLATVFGKSGLAKVVTSLISPSKSLYNWTKLGVQANGDLVSGVKDGIQAWRASNGIITESTGKVKGLSGVMNGATIAIKGMITGALGLATVHESMKSISAEGANLANVLGLVGGSIGTITSGVQIGAIFGPWGAVIGGATGALLSLMIALDEYKTDLSDVYEQIGLTSDKVNEFSNSMKEQYKSINEAYASESASHIYNENLLTELDGLIDANGRVKKGYEDRANFIVTTLNDAYGTELKIIDGKIENYEKERDSIKDIINEKKKQIALEVSEEKYKLALENKAESYNNLTTAKKNLTDAEKAYNERLESAIKVYNDVSKTKKQEIIDNYGSIESYAKMQVSITTVGKKYEEASKAYDNAREVYKTNTEAIMNYQGLLTADSKENSELIQKYLNEIGNSYVENGEIIKQSYSDQISDAQLYYDQYIKLAKENNIEITDSVKAFANERYNAVLGELINETKAIGKDGKVSADLASAWYTLGTTNKDKFLENFGKLPTDIQQKIVDKMYDKGYNVSSELQKGIKQINPEINIKTKTENATVKVDADVSQAKKKTDSWLSNLFKSLGSALGISTKETGGAFYGGSWHNIQQYANGGMPSHGSMFVAGERGAEIVGHINGRTEVLNQSQIASAIYSAVASAMSQYGGQSSQIDVHVHTDEGTVIDRINQRTKQTGICPINV